MPRASNHSCRLQYNELFMQQHLCEKANVRQVVSIEVSLNIHCAMSMAGYGNSHDMHYERFIATRCKVVHDAQPLILQICLTT